VSTRLRIDPGLVELADRHSRRSLQKREKPQEPVLRPAIPVECTRDENTALQNQEKADPSPATAGSGRQVRVAVVRTDNRLLGLVFVLEFFALGGAGQQAIRRGIWRRRWSTGAGRL